MPADRDPRQLRPRRTHDSNGVFELPGGTEDNDLWVRHGLSDDKVPVICSTFVPTAQQREAIAQGENIELVIFGKAQPPVIVRLTDVPIGKPPTDAPSEGA